MNKTDWVFHYTVTDDLTVAWSWAKDVSHKIYYTTWKPKPENIKILTEGLSNAEITAIQLSINSDLKNELDHHIKKRVKK